MSIYITIFCHNLKILFKEAENVLLKIADLEETKSWNPIQLIFEANHIFTTDSCPKNFYPDGNRLKFSRPMGCNIFNIFCILTKNFLVAYYKNGNFCSSLTPYHHSSQRLYYPIQFG